MKRILFFTISSLLMNLSIIAQSPKAFKYQAVARDAGGQVLANQSVSLQISMLQGSENGNSVYTESHNITTNDFGLINLEIGRGTIVSGDFNDIQWMSDSYFVQIEMDENGGMDYQLLGTSQLLSVPYAIHAETVDDKDDADADPENENQDLSYDTLTNELSITAGNTVALPGDNQKLEYDSLENMLTITGGNSILLFEPLQYEPLQYEPYLFLVEQDCEAIGFPGPNGSLTTIDLPCVEPQTLSLQGDTLSIQEGNSVTLPGDNQKLVYDSLENMLTITGGNSIFLSEPIDVGEPYSFTMADGCESIGFPGPNGSLTTIDLPCVVPQILSLQGNTLSIEEGNSVDLDAISLNVEDADADPKNELQTFENVIHNLSCSDKFELQIGHNEVDSNGVMTWVVDDSEFIPDPDPINELQRLDISPYLGSGSMLKILKKECIPDTLEPDLESIVWVPFDSVYIDDTNPTNELQTLTYNPSTGMLTISNGNDVALPLPTTGHWTETPSNDCIEYNGKATAEKYETKEGAVIIDDTGISRYNPSSGENVSNICLEDVGNTTWGKFEVLNNNDLVGNYQSCIHRSGIVDIYGPNGNYNVAIGHEFGLPNNGMVGVYDSANNQRTGMYVNNLGQGVLFGDVKNFRMEHPARPDKEIWYASLEGPEVAAYERGSGKLENGTVFISFSDHFKEVINPEGMTVMLTPLSAETYGLAVIEKNNNGFRVKELMQGTGNFEFDWEVKGVRKTYENYEVIREKSVNNLYHDSLEDDN